MVRKYERSKKKNKGIVTKSYLLGQGVFFYVKIP